MVTKEEILKKVQSIVSEQLGISKEQVLVDSHFTNDLGADSLDNVELVMAIEEEFNIVISDIDAEKISNVREAVEFIIDKINNKANA
uniref:Acyl carrier protein n=1 Tax=Cyanidium caldarium TaxID=2771 RepID=ACP_CYACA|nr:acyl carrier protein [Cyanidium caldarium]O19921.1 RecName: Full=Acyl carrier protein; Short=ACP [Cyanidium caldarium]AAB82668.1 unknown [Cyanidium caldarium]WDB00220.1 acyl carrier protein [Cyanidium caldarium]